MALPKMSLKLIIDKMEQKVLFAEAGKDFIDFLFSLLTIPIGSLLGVLDGNMILESGLPKLHQSVKDLDKKYTNPNRNKDEILKPGSLLPYVSRLRLLPFKSEQKPTVTYSCVNTFCTDKTYSSAPRACPKCYSNLVITDQGGFVDGMITYLVMDDLAVSPVSTISTSIACLHKHIIKDVGALEEKVVYVGLDEGMQLLKNALTSKTVLTNVFLSEVHEGNKPSKRVKAEDNTPLFV